MLTGFFMTIISKFVLQGIDGIGSYFTALETMPPSFLSALLVGYVVTVMWPDQELEQQYLQDLATLEDTDLKPLGNVTETISNA